MVIKARLKIVLTADNVVVAESEDPEIWQAAFQAIQGAGLRGVLGETAPQDDVPWVPDEERSAIYAMANELGIEAKDLLTACHPRMIAPYIFLNKHHWEAFRQQTAERGRTAVSNAVLALTLLLLWAEKINLERVTVRDGLAVLRVISSRDEHASRAVDNCPWLVKSSGSVRLRPEMISRAIMVARAFCTKTAPEWGQEDQPETE